jgi:serine/threonine protein kinase
MKLSAAYRFRRQGAWDLWIHKEAWTNGLWKEIVCRTAKSEPTDRPRVEMFRYPSEGGAEYYLKIYHLSHSFGNLKGLRPSKAFCALKQGDALDRHGFNAPFAVAAGENRRYGILKNAFLLTQAVEGSHLFRFLLENYSFSLSATSLKKKRGYIEQLAGELHRLHEMGFVHGDLTPTNILVQLHEGHVTVCFLDNDRTRLYPWWLPQHFWRRNLVQLNRSPLPGISLQDRMRFLHFYLRRRRWKKADIRLMRWLEAKTRKRIGVWDPMQPEVSFRRLLKWNGSLERS